MLAALNSLWTTSKKRKLETTNMLGRRKDEIDQNDENDEPPFAKFPTPDVTIDGSKGEGGGQIVRSSVSLSAVRMRSVTLSKIRHGRSKPGLQAQHLTSVNLVAEIASAVLQGAKPGSNALHMSRPEEPHKYHSLPLHAVVQTAGATSLVLQAALPAALRYLPGVDVQKGERTLMIDGGTTALYAPTSDYVSRVLVPNLRHFGIELTYSVEKHGFFPRGGGRCTVGIGKANCCWEGGSRSRKCFLRACDLRKRGDIVAIGGNIVLAGANYEKLQLAEHMRDAALRTLRKFTRRTSGYPEVSQDDITIQTLNRSEALDKCLAITLTASTASGSVLGSSAIWTEKKGKKGKQRQVANNVLQESAAASGEEAAEELCAAFETGAAVDIHMADQLCVFMGMAKGTSKVLIPKPSTHLNSVLEVCHAFNINIRIEEGNDTKNCMLVCDGMAMALA